MIIRPASYQREYTDHWSGDPAFVQPPTAPRPPETGSTAGFEEALKQYEKDLKEHERKLRVARETSDWKPLLIDGAQPTAFVMGQVDRNILRDIADRMSLPAGNRRWIGPGAGVALFFRLSVTKIVGLDINVARRPDPRWDDWTMASPDVVNELDAIDPSIVAELGDQVYQRLRGLSGK